MPQEGVLNTICRGSLAPVSSMTSMQSQMYAFSGFGDPVIIIITTTITITIIITAITITIIIITAITTSRCCASSWCFINGSNWMNPTWLWLRAQRPERGRAERKKWGCFPSSSYPGKTQQASGKVYPNAFPRSWWKETQILLSSRSLCRASYLGRILYLLMKLSCSFEVLTMSPSVDCYHQPNFQQVDGLIRSFCSTPLFP